jgi:hypothetical protein
MPARLFETSKKKLFPSIEAQLQKKICNAFTSRDTRANLEKLIIDTQILLASLHDLFCIDLPPGQDKTQARSARDAIILQLEMCILQLADSETPQAVLTIGTTKQAVAQNLKQLVSDLKRKASQDLLKHGAYFILSCAIAMLGVLMLTAACTPVLLPCLVSAVGTHVIPGCVLSIIGILLAWGAYSKTKSDLIIRDYDLAPFEQFADAFLDKGPYQAEVVRDDYLPNGTVLYVT